MKTGSHVRTVAKQHQETTMTMNFEVSRSQQFALLLSAVSIGVLIYLRGFERTPGRHNEWNRLDRHAPMHDLADGSFPASDPPSTVPAG
jgi:hypothetical protein